MCIDIVEIWFGIPNGQILSIFDGVTCPTNDSGGVLSFHIFILSIDLFCLPEKILWVFIGITLARQLQFFRGKISRIFI